MQIAGDLQPIVTGSSIKDGSSRGAERRGAAGHAVTVSLPGRGGVQTPPPEEPEWRGLASEGRDGAPPALAPERVPPRAASAPHRSQPKSTGCEHEREN